MRDVAVVLEIIAMLLIAFLVLVAIAAGGIYCLAQIVHDWKDVAYLLGWYASYVFVSSFLKAALRNHP